jgi:hypothetical protein
MIDQVALYAPLFAAAFGALAMFIKRAHPAGAWAHEAWGQFAIALGAGLATAGSQWWASGQLTTASLIAGAAGAIAGAAGVMDTSPKASASTPTFTSVAGGKQ